MAGTDDRPPDDPAFSPYPDETATPEALQCTVCGAVFDVVAGPDNGMEIADATAFLRKHRRCLRRVLEQGGVMARPAPAGPGRRRT